MIAAIRAGTIERGPKGPRGPGSSWRSFDRGMVWSFLLGLRR